MSKATVRDADESKEDYSVSIQDSNYKASAKELVEYQASIRNP